MPTEARTILTMLKGRRDYYGERNARYDHLINVWHGKLAELYPEAFAQDDMPKIANFGKLAWDSIAVMVGKVPDKIIKPFKLTDKAQERASLLEQICTGYDEASRIKMLHYYHAWYLVGLGASARGVVPDYRRMTPRFHVEDPRNVYPTPSTEQLYAARGDDQAFLSALSNPSNIDQRGIRGGRREVFTGGELEDVIIEKRAVIGALKHSFPGAAALLGPNDPDNLRRVVRLVQYFNRYEIITIVEGGRGEEPIVLGRAYHNLGFVPWRITETFAPDQVGGIGLIEEQIGLLVAHARILSQKLAWNDRTVWPVTWVEGDVATVSFGPHEILKLEPNSRMGQLSPPTEFQADKDLQTLDRYMGDLNRMGDPMRGAMQGGPITGRGLEQLMQPINTWVEHYWNLDTPDTEALYSYALAIDEMFWPDLKKEIAGRQNGEPFEATYTPARDIKGHRDVAISYGFGVGGVEGFIQSLQALGAELIDRRSVMEGMPGVTSVNDTLRRIELDKIDKSIYLAFEQGDVPRAQFLAQVRDAVSSGTPLTEAVVAIPAPTPPEQALQGIAGLPSDQLIGPEADIAALEAGGMPGQAPAQPALNELLAAVGV